MFGHNGNLQLAKEQFSPAQKQFDHILKLNEAELASGPWQHLDTHGLPLLHRQGQKETAPSSMPQVGASPRRQEYLGSERG